MQWNNKISLMPFDLIISKASPISLSLDIPVDNSIGRPFDAIYSINGVSVISKEAILKNGTFKLSNKSTPL